MKTYTLYAPNSHGNMVVVATTKAATAVDARRALSRFITFVLDGGPHEIKAGGEG